MEKGAGEGRWSRGWKSGRERGRRRRWGRTPTLDSVDELAVLHLPNGHGEDLEVGVLLLEALNGVDCVLAVLVHSVELPRRTAVDGADVADVILAMRVR